jgi:hypothetical protein
MLKRIAIATISIVGLLFAGALVLVVLAAITSDSGAGCTLATGRSISASAHLVVGLESGVDTATIRTLRHTIVVAPKKVTVDGKVLGVIARDVKNVSVRVGWTNVEVLADGEAVGAELEIAAKPAAVAR